MNIDQEKDRMLKSLLANKKPEVDRFFVIEAIEKNKKQQKPIAEEALFQPVVEPPKRPEVKVEQSLADQAAQSLTTNTQNNIVSVLQNKELDMLRKTLTQIQQKMSTMAWGGGGTGVVRFLDLDDHQHPEDVKFLKFNTNGPDYLPPPGSISWNPVEECMDVVQTDGTVLQTGLENYIRITNATGNTLNAGWLVQFTGVNGNSNPTAAPLVANSTFNPYYTIGVLTENIANSETGRATTFGKVRDLNTTGSSSGEVWSIGDLLWANPDPIKAGLLTKFKPTAPNVAVSVAAVTKVGVSDGEILVRPTITPRLYYGNFAHVGGNQTANNINTPEIVKWNRTEFASGHRIGSNNDIIADNSGLYNYQFSLQVSSTTSSKQDIYIWARKNEQDIPDSASIISINANGGNLVPSWNFVVSMEPNDRFQLLWAVSNLNLFLKGGDVNPWHPAIPSALLTVTQVNQ
jgi:hypothetical protein